MPASTRFFIVAALGLITATTYAETSLSLVPWPQNIKVSKRETHPLTKGGRVLFETRDAPRAIERTLEPLAEVLAGELELITGRRPKVAPVGEGDDAGVGDIVLRFDRVKKRAFAADESGEDQSYKLRVTPTEIVVQSKYTKGVAYGTTTLLQALSDTRKGFVVPCMRVADAPAAGFRNLMIDVARQPHSIGVLKDAVRMARMYKIRYLHLHLTDDQHFTFPFGPVTDNLEKNHAYTREELVDLVAYADARGVTLIPELDLPGHSTRLRQSGYLSPGENDADVASPANSEKINAIVDAMLEVFQSSPYFHIGGDESRAGSTLVPFIGAVNRHLRGNPPGGKRRLLVWEGFHGAPTDQVPAVGDDRVVVMAWESSYNAPWDLLKNDYLVINASWKPCYICGGPGGALHAGWTGGRQFYPQDLYAWDKNTFMHWEQGRPVYEDRGPNDPNRDDGVWKAEWIGRENQIIGGQMLFWEQQENAIINQLVDRLPVIAQRLWNPSRKESFEDFQARSEAASERVLTVVQPIAVLPKGNRHVNPIEDLYQPYAGSASKVKLVNRTRIRGAIRYEISKISGDVGYFRFSEVAPPTAASLAYKRPISETGGFQVRARLFRRNGEPVEGDTWQSFANFPNRVRVTDYNVGRKTLSEVPDLWSLPKDRIIRTYEMPMLRGQIRNVEVRSQMSMADLTPPTDGDFTFAMKTQSGHASLYLDVNRDGKWQPKEKLITNTPKSEKQVTAPPVKLRGGKKYRLRIDHNTGMPRPVLSVYFEGPGVPNRGSINSYLSLPKKPGR